MPPERWRQIEELYHTARTLTGGERASFVASVLDSSVRRELDSLLALDASAHGFLETPALAAYSRNPQPLEPGTRIGPYVIGGELAAGGMGQVYRAEDLRLGRSVALKFLCVSLGAGVDAVERFRRECRAVSALNHPSICTLHDVGEYDGKPFLVMELLEGESLKERLERGQLPRDELVDVALRALDALAAAHAKGIVHRDIKPANIFLTSDGRVKLLDFGLAKAIAESELESKLDPAQPSIDTSSTSLAGVAVGTAPYMSPEQVRGNRVDERSDLFSFGVMLFQLATGRLPFEGESAAIIREAILNREPTRPRALNPKIGGELEHIILKALAKDRAARYQTAAELLADLERARPGAPHAIYWSVLAATLAVALSVAFVAWWFNAHSTTPELSSRQVTANPLENGVSRANIAPDGLRLAYTDLAGIHVRNLKTGETRLIRPPDESYCYR